MPAIWRFSASASWPRFFTSMCARFATGKPVVFGCRGQPTSCCAFADCMSHPTPIGPAGASGKASFGRRTVVPSPPAICITCAGFLPRPAYGTKVRPSGRLQSCCPSLPNRVLLLKLRRKALCPLATYPALSLRFLNRAEGAAGLASERGRRRGRGGRAAPPGRAAGLWQALVTLPLCLMGWTPTSAEKPGIVRWISGLGAFGRWKTVPRGNRGGKCPV